MIVTPFLLDSAESAWSDPKTWTSAVIAFAAVAAMVFTYAWSRRHKEIDVTMHFQQAYDSLEARKKDVKNVEDARRWFGRYWQLQTRQFEYWVHGYVRTEIFTYWMRCRWADFKEQKCAFQLIGAGPGGTDLSYTYENGWLDFERNATVEHPYGFHRFIARVFELDEKDVPQYVRKKERELFPWHARVSTLFSGLVGNDPETTPSYK